MGPIPPPPPPPPPQNASISHGAHITKTHIAESNPAMTSGQVSIPITNPEQSQKQDPVTALSFTPVGGFPGKVEPIPAEIVQTVDEAGARFGQLKSRINFLDGVEDDKSDMMMFLLCCLLLGPIGLCIAACMSNSGDDKARINAESKKCIVQINALRDRFSSDPKWGHYEHVVEKIRPSVFSAGLSRQLLKGTL